MQDLITGPTTNRKDQFFNSGQIGLHTILISDIVQLQNRIQSYIQLNLKQQSTTVQLVSMEKQKLQILVYPKQLQKYRQKYLQPQSIVEFKKISDKQIMHEFEILSSSELIDSKVICKMPTKMNRYVNILTYEHNRVKIPGVKDYYVNASCMKSIVDGEQFAIFSQAPIPQFDNFWQAVYYKNVSMIIMVCSFVDPKRGNQAHKYWPKLNEKFKYKDLVIQTTSEKQLDKDIKESVFLLRGSQGDKIVKHYHWIGWSDMQPPVGNTLHILQNVIQMVIKQVDQKKPLIIHCSAGVGRTGTLAAIVEAERCFREKKELSVFAIVENFRKCRSGCIQTSQQYAFIYKYLMNKL